MQFIYLLPIILLASELDFVNFSRKLGGGINAFLENFMILVFSTVIFGGLTFLISN